MQGHPCRRTPGMRARSLIVALAATAACSAWAAEPNPYYIGVTQSVAYDSNVFRVPESTVLPASANRSDASAATGLVGGFDQNIGRQRFFGAAKLNLNRYQHNSSLNYTGYGANAGWDWATIEKLSGGFSVDVNQTLANQDNLSTTQPTTARDIVRTEQFATRARWGADGLISLDGAYSHSRVNYSENVNAGSTQDSGSLGGTYRAGPKLRLGAGVRLSRSEQAKGIQSAPGVYTANRTNGRNLDLSADWRPIVQSTVNARVSWTNQNNTGLTDRDFSGLTGALSASLAPTAKLSFTTSLSREAGTNASFFNLASAVPGQTISGLSENSQTTNSLSLGASYAATAKISLNAGLQYRSSKLVDQFTAGGAVITANQTDRTRSASLGGNYAIARNWSLGCNLAHMARDVSGRTSYDYSANTASCSAQFVLR